MISYTLILFQLWGVPFLLPYSTFTNQPHESIYLFCRSASNHIAKKPCNRFETSNTHFGIGYYQEGVALIYHVPHDIPGIIKTETIESFVFAEGISYFSIWKMEVTNTQYQLLKSKLRESLVWNSNDINMSGCADFCADILDQQDQHSFDDISIQMPLILFPYTRFTKVFESQLPQ